MTVIAIDTLSQAVEFLREDLGIANRRIDELLVALADARTAAMISGNEAAALLQVIRDKERPATDPASRVSHPFRRYATR